MIFILGLPNLSFSMSGIHESICEERNKIVIKFTQYGEDTISVEFCDLDSYLENGEMCEFSGGIGNWSYEYIGDLNNDGIPDVILSLTPNSIWGGIKLNLVLVGCKDGTYVEVLEELFASLAPIKKSDKNGWVRLAATRQYLKHNVDNGGGFDSFNSQNFELSFDSIKKTYLIVKKGKIHPMKGEDDVAWVSQKINIPPNYKFNWGVFPQEILLKKTNNDSLELKCNDKQ
jgi:hypothetical protein